MSQKNSNAKLKKPTKSANSAVDSNASNNAPFRAFREQLTANKSAQNTANAAVSTWIPKIVEPTPEDRQAALEYAFPVIDPGLRPFGSRVLLQIRAPREKSDGGIIIPDEAQDTEKWNTTIAKVIALGPCAFRNRDTLELWPEGSWCKVGDFVWCPKYGGQRHQLKNRGQKNNAMFVEFNDLDLNGECTIDPLSIVMYI